MQFIQSSKLRMLVICNLCMVLTMTPSLLAEPLPNVRPLTMDGDIASELVAGVDRFLLRELQRSVAQREQHWQRDFSSPKAYLRSLEPNRDRLAHMLGLRDERVTGMGLQVIAQVGEAMMVGRGENYDVWSVSWPAFADVTGQGLLLRPRGMAPLATVIALPDCNVLPEQLVGLLPGVPAKSQYARRLAENGCEVIVPLLINREEKLPKLTNREWLYRSAFELGGGLVGYEVQKVLSIVDWVVARDRERASIGVMGWGEGGLIALYAAAVDPRIDAACISGYFAPREEIWREPLDRNLFGLLEQFGDAELAAMVTPRTLVIEACAGPERTIPGGRGAPARTVSPALADVRREVDRCRGLLKEGDLSNRLHMVTSGDGQGPYGSDSALARFLEGLAESDGLRMNGTPPEILVKSFDPDRRHALQVHEINRHTQNLLRKSHYVRQSTTMKRFDYKSVEAYEASAVSVREFFYNDVIGRFSHDLLPPNVRAREFLRADTWTAHEVVMDVFPDVIAYGLLLLPNDLSLDEPRPVVVCQHGLEGRPQHTIGSERSEYYSAFAAKLAERGFITFAPQNLYIFQDRFRTLQRKANPLKKSLFSIITPQHQQIVDWLQTLPFVDPNRIGFYGLSYGGKTAMRVPALVTDYCLSICSADFNEWVDKNASTINPRSYSDKGEYEIFEFDLGGTFNYAEMAALIAPRPFMVERGHFDGVADDWTVAYEYAKIRHLYAAKLGIPDRTEIEWFVGPHKIHGVGAYQFLHRHLRWPAVPSRLPRGDLPASDVGPQRD